MKQVADYIAYCKHCGGWVAVADASTPEMKQANAKYAGRWAKEGHKVELVEHDANDPMPPQCKRWPNWWECADEQADT